MKLIKKILFVVIAMGSSQLLANDNVQLVQNFGKARQESTAPKNEQILPFTKQTQLPIHKNKAETSHQINASITIIETVKSAAQSMLSSFGRTYNALTLKLAPKPELKSS